MENTEIRIRCIALSKQCVEECRSTAMLSKNFPHMKRCTELSLRCAEECEFLISVCMNNSIENSTYYDMCSIACGACASECEKYDLPQLRKCAEICRKFQLTYIFKTYQIQKPISQLYGNAKI